MGYILVQIMSLITSSSLSEFSFHPLGLPNTCGLVGLKHSLASVDALVVQRLKEAGGIALGVMTNEKLKNYSSIGR